MTLTNNQSHFNEGENVSYTVERQTPFFSHALTSYHDSSHLVFRSIIDAKLKDNLIVAVIFENRFT